MVALSGPHKMLSPLSCRFVQPVNPVVGTIDSRATAHFVSSSSHLHFFDSEREFLELTPPPSVTFSVSSCGATYSPTSPAISRSFSSESTTGFSFIESPVASPAFSTDSTVALQSTPHHLFETGRGRLPDMYPRRNLGRMSDLEIDEISRQNTALNARIGVDSSGGMSRDYRPDRAYNASVLGQTHKRSSNHLQSSTPRASTPHPPSFTGRPSGRSTSSLGHRRDRSTHSLEGVVSPPGSNGLGPSVPHGVDASPPRMMQAHHPREALSPVHGSHLEAQNGQGVDGIGGTNSTKFFTRDHHSTFRSTHPPSTAASSKIMAPPHSGPLYVPPRPSSAQAGPVSTDTRQQSPRRRHSDSDPLDPYQSAIHSNPSAPNFVPDLSRRNSAPPIHPASRNVRFTSNLICPSPVLPSHRRQGWFNRRGDQLWTNSGYYKPPPIGQEYPLDLVEYPDFGEGWMNELGTRIDMQHCLIPKVPLRSALKVPGREARIHT